MSHGKPISSKWRHQGLLYLCLIGGAALIALPLWWLLALSLETPSEIYSLKPHLWPGHFQWSNYGQGWVRSGFARYFGNTLWIASGAVLGSVIFNSMAGFALAKYNFPGRNGIFLFILAALMMPLQVNMAPLYLLMVHLKWVNTFQGAIFPTISQAFGVFLMRQYCLTIPSELIDAARIDGCSDFRAFWRVVFPLCAPATTVNLIFQFMWRWNDLLWPLIIMQNEELYTIQQGLAFLREDATMAGGPIMAMALVSALPIVLLFLGLQRYFVQGISLSGMKA